MAQATNTQFAQAVNQNTPTDAQISKATAAGVNPVTGGSIAGQQASQPTAGSWVNGRWFQGTTPAANTSNTTATASTDPNYGKDTGVQGEMSFTRWKQANPSGSYADWKATLPGGSTANDVTSQYAATKQLAQNIGSPDANGNYSAQQQAALDAVNQFNSNFGKQMNVNLAASQQQASQTMQNSANVPTTTPTTPQQAGTEAPAPQAQQQNVPGQPTGQTDQTGQAGQAGPNMSQIANTLHSGNMPGLFDGSNSNNAYSALMEGMANMTNQYLTKGLPVPDSVQQMVDNFTKMEAGYASMTQTAQSRVLSNLVDANNAGDVLRDAQLQANANEQQAKENMLQGDIDIKRESNARFAAYLKGAMMGAGMTTASAAIDSIQYQSEVHSWELEKMEQGKTAATNSYLDNARQITAQFAQQAIQRNTAAQQQMDDLQKNLMTQVTDIEKQKTSSQMQIQKDMLSAVNDLWSKQATIIGQAKQDDQFAQTYAQNQLKINLQTQMLANTLNNQKYTQLGNLYAIQARNGKGQDPALDSQITALENSIGFGGGTGTTSGDMNQTPAVRNNNPGNLRGPDGEFQTFPDMQTGFNAMVADLGAKQNGTSKTGINGKSTLQQMISVYAPTSDGNDPVSYAKTVAQTLGVTPDTPIGQLDTKQLALAMAQHEDPQAYSILTGSQPVGGSKIQWNLTDPSRPDPATANIVDSRTGKTPNDIWQSAILYALKGGNLQQFTGGLGTGVQGTTAKNSISGKSAAIIDAAGVDKGTLEQEYAANSKAIDTQVNYLNTVQRALNGAESGAQKTQQLFGSLGINPLDSTYANMKINDLTKQFGSSGDIRAYQAAMTEIGNEYAQVFARGGPRSVEGTQAAQALIDGNMKLSDIQKTFDTLQSIGKTVVGSSIQQIKGIAGGGGTDAVAQFMSFIHGGQTGQASGNTQTGSKTFNDSTLATYMQDNNTTDRVAAMKFLQDNGYTYQK